MRPEAAPEVVLETDRLILRTFTEADVDALVELDSDPEVTRFITNGAPTPRATVVDEILPAFLGYYAGATGYGFWAAIEKDTGAFIGWFHLRPPSGRWPAGRARARLPAAPGVVGQGLRDRGLARADRSSVLRAGREPRVRGDDGREHRVAPGDGEGRPSAGAHLPRRLAGAHPRRRARGRGIRDHARRVGGGSSASRTSRNVRYSSTS